MSTLISMGLVIGLFNMIVCIVYLITLKGKRELPFTLGSKIFETGQDVQSMSNKAILLLITFVVIELILVTMMQSI